MKRKMRPIHLNRISEVKRPVLWKRYTLILTAAFFVSVIITLILLAQSLPSLTELEDASDPVLISRILSKDGVVLDELFFKKRIYVPFDLIPESMKEAVLASEDRRFYQHWGLDLKRVGKAIMVDLIHMEKKEGASTLTQQLARNLYLNKKKTWARKLREQLTAIQIERTYSKDEILEMYLNYMELGRGAHGVQAASLAYFGKNVDDLEVQEAAFIAGMFQLPYGPYNPDRDSTKSVIRRNVVLRGMVNYDAISEAAYDSLSLLPLNVIPRNSDENHAIAPYFCEYVRQIIERKWGTQIYTEGFTIYTSLDTKVQACAEKAVNHFMPQLDDLIRKRFLRKKEYVNWFDPPLSTQKEINSFLADTTLMDSMFYDNATVQCALTALDPSNGQILAMIGGRDFNKWKFNRAVQATRQPGSAFKPIIYTAAVDNGWPVTKEFLNQPVVIKMVDGTEWRPSNYEKDEEGGLVTIRRGLAKSYNLVAVRLVQELQLQEKGAWYARKFGFTTTINPFDAIILGVDVVHPIELTSAYGVFANKGILTEPVAILKVEDKNGNVIYEAEAHSKEVLTEATAYLMTNLLQSVITEGTGISTRAYNFTRPCAGKTGTTNDYRNAWFVGFTPQIVAGVWVGMDDQTISLGEGRSGATTALPIWAPFMKMTHDTLNLPVANFHQPPGIVNMTICMDSKLKATPLCPRTRDEIFLKDTEPMKTCNLHGSGQNRKKSSNQQVF